MSRFPLLGAEALEDRLVPATVTPWADPGHLTVSFVPDGTLISQPTITTSKTPELPGTKAHTNAPISTSQGVRSTLFRDFSADGMSSTAWQMEILRALQTWADDTNINLAVVPDSGAPLGTVGASQGDIRIAGTTLGDTWVASTVLPSAQASAWSGDVLFNTSDLFGIRPAAGYDLYSVALHEAGHALGLHDNSDPSSAMYTSYLGVRTGLDAADVASIQSLYGIRNLDVYEGASGNGTPVSATALPSLGTLPVNGSLGLQADIGSSTDIDYYSLQTGPKSNGFAVSLTTANASWLLAGLTVLDSTGKQLAATIATDPLQGNLSLSVAAQPKQTYYIKVAAAPNACVFGIGSYRLSVVPSSNPGKDQANGPVLTPVPANESGQVMFQQGQDGQDDTRVYQLVVPTAGGPSVAAVNLGVNPNGEAPAVTVTDDDGHTVNVQTTTANGHLDLQFASAAGTYFLTMTAGKFQAPAPSLASPSATPPLVASGTVTSAQPATARGLTMLQDGVMHLQFLAGAVQGKSNAALEVVLADVNGNVLLRQVLQPGQSVDANLFLTAGNYTVFFVGGTPNRSSFNLGFQLRAENLSEPSGPSLTDPSNPDTAPSYTFDPIWYDTGFSVLLALTDPYGTPISLPPPGLPLNLTDSSTSSSTPSAPSTPPTTTPTPTPAPTPPMPTSTSTSSTTDPSSSGSSVASTAPPPMPTTTDPSASGSTAVAATTPTPTPTTTDPVTAGPNAVASTDPTQTSPTVLATASA